MDPSDDLLLLDDDGDSPFSSCQKDMDLWFSKAKIVERDALSALQLLYRFQGDNLGNLWWIHLQSMGFKHNGTTYDLPKVAPAYCRRKSYTAAELYGELDRLAVPQLTSPYQEFPVFPSSNASTTTSTEEEHESQNWWQSARDILVFRRLRTQIEGFRLNQLPSPLDNVVLSNSSSKDDTGSTRKGNKRRIDSQEDAGAELFMQKNKKKSRNGSKVTSMRYDPSSSSKVRFPSMIECVKEISDKIDLTLVERNEALLVQDFSEWKFQTIMNHSLLCYGVGSKRRVLNMFADELEADGESVIVIDGFHKDVTIEGILDLITAVWLPTDELRSYDRYDVHVGIQLGVRPFGRPCNYPSYGEITLVQRAGSISRALACRVNEKQRGYYLILHGIDGVGLRNSTAQEALATLVSFSTTKRGLYAFHLIASVDHVNAPALLWDSSTFAQFAWIWKVLHTHRPYIEELLYGKHTDEKTTKAVARHRNDTGDPTQHDAIFTVLSSLAPRHAESLQQLAGLQADQMAADASRDNPSSLSRSSSSWVPYKTLFRQCQRKCVVHGDEQLRRFLQELKDHGLVEQNSGDSTEVLSYRIPHGVKTLKDILEFSHN